MITQVCWWGYVIHEGTYFNTRLYMAASVIQSHWRKYHTRRKADCIKTRNDHFFGEISRQKHAAATVIQVCLQHSLCRFSDSVKKISYLFCVLYISYIFLFMILSIDLLLKFFFYSNTLIESLLYKMFCKRIKILSLYSLFPWINCYYFSSSIMFKTYCAQALTGAYVYAI